MAKANQHKEVKYLTTDQLKQLLNVVIDRKDKLIIRLLLDTGMRIGEFLLMEMKHLEVSECYIRIPAENTKTKTPRTVRINRDLMNDLLSYCKDMDIKEGYIWKGFKRGKPITKRAIQKMIKVYGIKIGIPWLTPHKFRHSHIVRALENGVPINAVQAQVGHANIQTTQIYSSLAPREVKNAYERAGL